jgi:hypothetical protein
MNTRLPLLISLIVLLSGGNLNPGELRINIKKNFTREYALHLLIVTIKRDSTPLLPGVSADGYAIAGLKSIDRLCREYKITEIEPFYKGNLRKHALRREVSRIYLFYLSEGIDPLSITNVFSREPNIESAEPYFIPELLYEPDDPLLEQQWHLARIHATDAWDIVRGDTTRHSVVGIVDTGVNWYHPDLAENIWVNPVEDINDNGIFDPDDLNGFDDDGNGFVDDVIGWDFDDDDNDPSEGGSSHGTGVAGCASEVTDNGILGAGIGFSARIMCVKATPWYMNMDVSYQGMVYAADNGADIINCSWAVDTSVQYQQNIINAIWEENVLIIAGAGNRGNDEMMYPAAYEHVMAVAGTEQNDFKAEFSSYGTWVDISAPAEDIWLTCFEDDFQERSGTSYASPLTAGAAALLRAYYPNLTNDEVEYLIEISADPIDHLNPGYEGLLGAGRINAFAGVMTAIEGGKEIPLRFSLFQNYPNPFNAATVIKYNLPRILKTRISIYNLLGQRIAIIFEGIQDAGEHSITWDASAFPSGVYFARLEARGRSKTVKMVLLK